MDTLYWLDQIKPHNRHQVGEKAFNFSRVKQLGYPVVPGFVIPAEVLRQFLESLNGSEPLVSDLPHSSLHVDVDNWRQLQQVATRVRQEIITASVPPQWVSSIHQAALRWQASCLIFRPCLRVPKSTVDISKSSGLIPSQICRCQPEAIANTLKQIWSQLFGAKSLMYWQRMGVNLQAVHLAILVQPLQDAIASGTLNASNMGLEIEATWGLGIAITQGEVLPDAYQVRWETGEVLSRDLGNKMLVYRLPQLEEAGFQPVPTPMLSAWNNCLQAYLPTPALQQQFCLQEDVLQQLIQLATRLSREFGKTFSVEWIVSGSQNNQSAQVYLTQITTPPLPINHTYEIKGLAAAAGKVKATAYVIPNSEQKPDKIPQGVILVARSIAPDWLPLLQQVAGIITEKGGLTSHGAILARELGIPAVVNVSGATTLIQSREPLFLDGDKGEIYLLSNQDTDSNGETHTRENAQHKPSLPPIVTSTPQASSLPIISTQLLVNLSQPQLIEQVQRLRVDGVGLLRSELMAIALLEGQHPNSWLMQGRSSELLERWIGAIIQFVRGFAPRPVFYRSLDWRAHELSSLSNPDAEDALTRLNGDTESTFPPAERLPFWAPSQILGERGTFSYLSNPAVFDLELAALRSVQQSGYQNFHLLLPFVRTVEEFTFCRRRVEQAGLTQIPQFQMWIMAEVPSVLFLLPEYIKAGVQGISIGTNDLTQLILGVDRDLGELAAYFDERHPAVMSAIAQLIRMATTAGIPCSICGQAPALYPEIIEHLVQWGITSISVEPEAIERTWAAIARAEQRLILQAARRQLYSTGQNHPYGG